MAGERDKKARTSIDRVESIIKAALVASLAQGSKTYHYGISLGITVGALCSIVGLVAAILGLTGSIEWVFEGSDFTSRLSNASPGVVFALMGMLVLWRYRPHAHSHLEISKEEVMANEQEELQDLDLSDLFEASGETWGGNASCTITKSDGSTKTVSKPCSGEVSYSNAKRRLEAAIRAEVRAEGGRITAQISFSISKEFKKA